MGHAIDGGDNIIGRLARVDKAWRGTGVWNRTRYITIHDYLTNRYPGVQYYLGAMTGYRNFNGSLVGFDILMVRVSSRLNTRLQLYTLVIRDLLYNIGLG